MLIRLLKKYPGMSRAGEIRAALDANLTTANLSAEAAYLDQPNRQSFERTYGWAWLLKLAEELSSWQDECGARWLCSLEPLAKAVVARYLAFLPKQNYPIRSGVHPNTAFGLAFALDFARAVEHRALETLVTERARSYFSQDADYPASWEPGGEDFFSPCLTEADLMRRVLEPTAFREWFSAFLPGVREGKPARLLDPAHVPDRTDPKLGHLDGLNLSRAWCMRAIACMLPEEDAARGILSASAARHAQAALEHVASGDYMGEHWLASFAVYLLT
jgi:hypothetical protein